MAKLKAEQIRPAEVENLTDWDNEPSVADLKQDYTDAYHDHELQEIKIDHWLDQLNVTGTAKPKKHKGKSNAQPRLIRKQAEWRYSSLSEPFLSTEDIYNIEPVTWEDAKPAKQNELVLNYQFNNKINKVDFIDEYVRTAVDEGTVFVRVGWEYMEEEVTEEKPVFEYIPSPDPQTAQMLQQIGMMREQNPTEYLQLPDHVKQAFNLSMNIGVPVIPVPKGIEEVTETKVLKNQPTVEVCDYKNLVLDPSCNGEIEKAKFIIYSFETSRTELEYQGIYKNLDEVDYEANTIVGNEDHDTEAGSFNFQDEARKRIVAYEYWGYWDINDDGLVKSIVATWIGDVMIRMEESPYPDGKLPFVSAQYLPVRKSLYGEPDGELLEENQKTIGALTRGMIDVMARSANGQQGYRKDALDVTNRRKFEKGEDYEYNATVDPRLAFHMHTYPELPQSALTMLEYQYQDAESLTGVKAFQSGISGSAYGNTATGVRSVLDATSKRELGILNRLAQGIKDIGRKIISMNSIFLEEEEVIRVTNEQFVPIRRDDLYGKFDLKLNISTAEVDNHKAEQLAFMLQTLGNTVGQGLTQMILAKIAELRKMPVLAKQIIEYQPEPDPMQQQLQMLEIEKLKAEIAKLNSEAQENMAEANLDMAKARESTSKADLNDLDFLEQESGVKQQRDLQQQGAQARANEDLERTKFGLDQLSKANEREQSARENILSNFLGTTQ
jgi:hypothetical protein